MHYRGSSRTHERKTVNASIYATVQRNYGVVNRDTLRRAATHYWAAYTNTGETCLRRVYFQILAAIRHAKG